VRTSKSGYPHPKDLRFFCARCTKFWVAGSAGNTRPNICLGISARFLLAVSPSRLPVVFHGHCEKIKRCPTVTALIPFSFENHSVRVTTDNQGTPWFVAVDVAKALGYADPSSTVSKHCDNAKLLKDIALANLARASEIKDLPGNAKLIREGDVFRLALRSDLPSARPFQDWVETEVLPSIRKTGSYSAPGSTVVAVPPYQHAATITPIFVQAAEAFGFKGNQATLSANRAINTFTGINLLEAMGQAALASPDNQPLITATDIAIRLGIGKREANPLLVDCELQTAHRDHKSRLYYELTEEGQKYGVLMDTDKKTGGTPIRQIKWSASVLPILEARLQVENEHQDAAA